MKILLRKSLIFLILYFLWPNLWFFFLVKDIYNDPFYLISLFLYYIVFFADVMIRPLEEKRRDAISEKYDQIMALLIFSSPFWFCLYVLEYRTFFITLIDPSFSVFGILLFILGSIILLTSRIQLGRFASGKLKIQDEHKLITSGIYKYSRNPIYFGGLIAVLGMGLALRSIVTIIFIVILDLYVFIQRISREEEILAEEFGDDFIRYKKETKRLIPFIY